jgi:hypothetical protein
MIVSLTFLITLLVASLGSVPAGASKASVVVQNSAVEEVTFCQLANDPDRFDGKVVRFRARSVWSIPDTFFIYSPECEATHIDLDFTVDGPESVDGKRLLETIWSSGMIDGKISDNNRAEMTFTGRFEVPPQKRTAATRPYYRLHLQTLEDIHAIPASQP